MLVIANGAFKSGSTWQRNLLKRFADFVPLPEEYRNKKRDSFIETSRLRSFLESDYPEQYSYLAKGHIYNKKDIELLVSKPEKVKVFIIHRDIRDAIVSHYNHFKNVRKTNMSFSTYYWLVGRYKAMQLVKYEKNWDIHKENVLHSRFEDLKRDVSGELKKYAEFLDIELPDEKIREIIEENSLERTRARSHRKWFFRKGEVGDYKNFLSPSMERDLERIEKRIGVLDDIVYYFLFDLRYI